MGQVIFAIAVVIAESVLALGQRHLGWSVDILPITEDDIEQSIESDRQAVKEMLQDRGERIAHRHAQEHVGRLATQPGPKGEA